jgi:hypothetical protein
MQLPTEICNREIVCYRFSEQEKAKQEREKALGKHKILDNGKTN